LITISGVIMLIEKNIFISGLIISTGCGVASEGSVEPTLRGFISTLNARKSYRLDEGFGEAYYVLRGDVYAYYSFGLCIWSDLSNKPFYKWPYLLDYSKESDRKDIKRKHKSISVYTKVVKPNVFTLIDRYGPDFVFHIIFSILSLEKSYYNLLSTYVLGRIGKAIFSKIKIFFTLCSIKISREIILVYDHHNIILGKLYILPLMKRFIRRNRYFTLQYTLDLDGFILRAKRSEKHLIIEVRSGRFLSSNIRMKIDEFDIL